MNILSHLKGKATGKESLKNWSRKENACNNPMIIITNNKMPPLYFPKIWLQKIHRSSISELIQPFHKAKEKRAMVIIISLNYSLTWLLMAGKIHTSRNIKKLLQQKIGSKHWPGQRTLNTLECNDQSIKNNKTI